MNKLKFLSLSLDEQIETWNEFSRENYWEMEIHPNDDIFFKLFYTDNPLEAVRSTQYGDYDYMDDYCYIDGSGNVSSFTFVQDFHDIIDIDEMLVWYNQYIK